MACYVLVLVPWRFVRETMPDKNSEWKKDDPLFVVT